MPTMNCETSALLVVDFQSRLMPAIDNGAAVTVDARHLIDAAGPILRRWNFEDHFSSFVPRLINLGYLDYRCGIAQKPWASTPSDGLNLLR
jgi:hypothetical protein